MSVKHVKDYYNQIYCQYQEMASDIKDLEEAVSNKIVFPEQLEEATKQLDKLKENYQRINYIIFLLNLPNNPQKEKKVVRRLKKDAFEPSDTLSGVKAENQRAIANFNEKIKEISTNCIK